MVSFFISSTLNFSYFLRFYQIEINAPTCHKTTTSPPTSTLSLGNNLLLAHDDITNHGLELILSNTVGKPPRDVAILLQELGIAHQLEGIHERRGNGNIGQRHLRTNEVLLASVRQVLFEDGKCRTEVLLGLGVAIVYPGDLSSDVQSEIPTSHVNQMGFYNGIHNCKQIISFHLGTYAASLKGM